MPQEKVRIYEISKQLGVPNKDVIAYLKDQGVDAKSHSSSIDKRDADKAIAHFSKGGKAKAPAKKATNAKADKKTDEKAKTKKSTKKVEIITPSSPESRERKLPDPSAVRIIKRAADSDPKEDEKKKAEEEAKKKAEEEAKKKAQAEAKKKAEEEAKKKLEEEEKPKSGLRIIRRAADNKPKEATKESPAAKAADPVKKVDDAPSRGRSKTSKDDDEPLPKRRPKPMVSPSQSGRPRPPRRPSRKPRKTKRQAIAEKKEAQRKKIEEEEAALAALPKVISIPVPLTVAELAEGLRLRETELIKHLFMKGNMVTVNQTLDVEFARTVAKEFEFSVQEEDEALEKETAPEEVYETIQAEPVKKLDESKFKNLEERSPVISIMGHVDHGKTTLLDALRETRQKIVDTEAGGITQSIGAYSINKDGQRVVFLDTPGHEAFTSMRMRGAQTTDIAILVVAADDGIMPQTIEAINHAKAAKIPILVAVNKIDKDGADPDRVLVQLADHGLASEKWGGETLTNEVSALQKMGLDELLDNILLMAELLELKADATVPGEGVVIEAQLDKRIGSAATLLVQNGTLRVGDNILIGPVGGRVRALIDENGERVDEAGPATPVKILGLNDVPNAGDEFVVIDNDKAYKQRLSAEKLRSREQKLNITQKNLAPGITMSVDSEGRQTDETHFNVVVKADTQGSLEALVDVLNGLTTEEIKVNVLHSGTGDISEADIMLASAGNAVMIGFNANPTANAEVLAEQQQTVIKSYDVIYHVAEEIEKMMLGKLSPEVEEIKTGEAEVRQLFNAGKTVIAGCMVTEGKVVRNAKADVFRDGEVVFSGKMDNLKRFKEDAKEVAAGYECGISFDKFNDLQEGDRVVVYTLKETERTSLSPSSPK